MANQKNWIFDHPILNNLPPLNRNEISILIEQIKNDIDKELKKELLLFQLLAYIRTRLVKIVQKMPLLKNDIDGLVGYLIEWLIILIERKLDTYILHYVSTALRGECLKYQYKMNLFGPSEMPKVWRHQHRKILTSDVTHDSKDELKEIEIRDDILARAKSNIERIYLQKRMEGYTNKEIAAILNTTESTISRIRKTLERRFNES